MRTPLRNLAIAWVIALTAGTAAANGRFPSVISAHWQQGDGTQLIIGATFGGIYSKDNAKSFRWMCEKAIGYGGFFDPEFALSLTGVLYASTFDGLARSEDGGCSWGYAYGDILGYWVDGFALHPTNPSILLAGTSSGGKMNGLMKLTDGGKSFTTVPGTLSMTQFWKSLRFAPSDGNRVYATSYIATPASNTWWVSRDAGDSFTPSDFPQGGGAEFKLLAVHPTNPDIVFARTVMAGVGEQPYTVFRSTDAGAHWTQVFQTTGGELLTTLSISNDGQSVVIAATTSVYKSTDGGMSFQKKASPAPQLVCTTVHGGNLYGCGNNFSDGFAVGRSEGFGAVWTHVGSGTAAHDGSPRPEDLQDQRAQGPGRLSGGRQGDLAAHARLHRYPGGIAEHAGPVRSAVAHHRDPARRHQRRRCRHRVGRRGRRCRQGRLGLQVWLRGRGAGRRPGARAGDPFRPRARTPQEEAEPWLSTRRCGGWR